jgi:hypothetical protein
VDNCRYQSLVAGSDWGKRSASVRSDETVGEGCATGISERLRERELGCVLVQLASQDQYVMKFVELRVVVGKSYIVQKIGSWKYFNTRHTI